MSKLLNKNFKWISIFLLFICFAFKLQANLSPCSVSSITIKSGWNYNTSTYFLPGVFDPYWIVVKDQNNSTVEPRPGNVDGFGGRINSGILTAGVNNHACLLYANSCTSPANSPPCIGIAPQPGNTLPDTGVEAPIVFNFSFCINPGTNLSAVNFSFTLGADDFAKVCLNGNFLHNTLTCNTNGSSCAPFVVNNPSFFNIGVNVISVTLNNIGSGPTWFNIDGGIYFTQPNSGSFQSPNCCPVNKMITGQKFLDANSNGVKNVGEGIVTNWPIILKDGLGNTVATTQTDLYGNYFFMGLTGNNYQVHEGVQPFWTQTFPASGFHTANFATNNNIIANLNFGNSPGPPCNNAAFSFNPSNNPICPGVLTFTAVPCPNPSTTYSWSFGNGATGSGSVVSQNFTPGTYLVTLSVTSIAQTNTLTFQQSITISSCICPPPVINTFGTPCVGPLNFTIAPCTFSNSTYSWNFGNGSVASGTNVTANYSNPGTYTITVSASSPFQSAPTTATQQIVIKPCQPPQPCQNCIGSFAPDPGNYMISLWVREDINPQPATYNNAKIQVSFTGNTAVFTFGTNPAKNKVIEGWQRIEESFTIPLGATHVNLNLINLGGSGAPDAYFDDIRIFPRDGQMKTYVYDPISLRLSAMLDENNYATFYEYDEEGKLIRIKKETEKGIMTIQESREGLKKQ